MRLVISLLALCLATIQTASATPLEKRVTDFFSPAAGGGSELDIVSPGLGEPMNVIISGLSSPGVLTDSGFLNFAQAIGFSFECVGIHIGAPQAANLGDGNGAVNQTTELRQDFGDALLGTCLESLIGGNHLRMYRQNGPTANSGALFLAVSREEPITQSHTIVPNGYNIGRDELVANATNTNPKPSFLGVTYSATVTSVSGLLPSGTAGVNHGIAQDGIVKLLTVTID